MMFSYVIDCSYMGVHLVPAFLDRRGTSLDRVISLYILLLIVLSVPIPFLCILEFMMVQLHVLSSPSE